LELTVLFISPTNQITMLTLLLQNRIELNLIQSIKVLLNYLLRLVIS